MRMTILIPAMAAAATAAFAPVSASAQSFGVYVGSGYPAYGYPDRGYYAPRYDNERREAWVQHERWEQRRAWEQRERWEQQEARRRYWQRDGWEHHGERHEDDD